MSIPGGAHLAGKFHLRLGNCPKRYGVIPETGKRKSDIKKSYVKCM